MSGKRFLSWIAVSSKAQAEKVSPELQAQLARDHAARWNGTIIDELSVAESRDIVLLSDAAAAIPDIQRAVLGPSAYAEYNAGRVSIENFVTFRRSRDWGVTVQRASLGTAMERTRAA